MAVTGLVICFSFLLKIVQIIYDSNDRLRCHSTQAFICTIKFKNAQQIKINMNLTKTGNMLRKVSTKMETGKEQVSQKK